MASMNCHEIVISHKRGLDIPIADALSRMGEDSAKAQFVEQVVEQRGLLFVEPVLNDYVFFASFL